MDPQRVEGGALSNGRLRPGARHYVVAQIRDLKARLGVLTYAWSPIQSEMVRDGQKMTRVRTMPDEDLPENRIEDWQRLMRRLDYVIAIAEDLKKFAADCVSILDRDEGEA